MMPTKEQEAATLAELRDCLQAVTIYQETFPGLVKRFEPHEAEGRRCILRLTGMLHHRDMDLYCQVVGGVIRWVEPYGNHNALIEAPLDIVVRVLRRTLDGDENAFADAWATGRARIRGPRRMHDGMIFTDVFRRLARMIRPYVHRHRAAA